MKTKKYIYDYCKCIPEQKTETLKRKPSPIKGYKKMKLNDGSYYESENYNYPFALRMIQDDRKKIMIIPKLMDEYENLVTFHKCLKENPKKTIASPKQKHYSWIAKEKSNFYKDQYPELVYLFKKNSLNAKSYTSMYLTSQKKKSKPFKKVIKRAYQISNRFPLRELT